MYEDHWFASAQENAAAAQQQSRRPKVQSRYTTTNEKVVKSINLPKCVFFNSETDRCQIAIPLRSNGLNHQKLIASNGPPLADVRPRSNSIHDLRNLSSTGNNNADRQVAIDRELMDERDVAIWYEDLEDELQAANNDDFL